MGDRPFPVHLAPIFGGARYWKALLLGGLATVALGGSGAGLWPGRAMATSPQYETLFRAICLNDWAGAIALIGPLMAQDTTLPSDRQALVRLRSQLEALRTEGGVIAENIESCEPILRRYVTAQAAPQQPLDWASALQGLSFARSRAPRPPITAAERQGWAVTAAGLDNYELYDIPSLARALVISTETGIGVSGGSVDRGVQVFTFFGGLGDQVDIAIEVTRIRPGALYTDDDTQLFLFDAEGYLLAENDDFNGLQSRLVDVVLPRTGRYFLAVTTYNRSPLLNEVGQIVDWEGVGGSAVDYTLTLRGVTPTPQLILTNYR